MTASLDMCEKMSIDVAEPLPEIDCPLPTWKSGPADIPKLFCKFDEVSVLTGEIA